MSNAHVWRAALERLRPQMTRAQFDTWLRGTSLAAAPDGAVVLRVRTTFAKELLETRFRERIESAIAEVSGRPCRLTVAVAPDTASADEPRPDVQVPARTITAHAQAARTLPARRPSRSLRDATAAPTLFDVPPTQPRVSPSSKPLTTTVVGATHAS
ncbi:MAG TPA: DnaA N-terminal domain-containing protein, partial [Ktedonobacterales bacterium]|nr:DnaA N-terminal domain-containing protein [Ktedonobacterales bacterium]